ncbi:PREDICTED: uncharacterized protein LOC109582172 [Amphimedon queenslandica]|uniref:Uncharacterized protein n=1 Tax=Amphimedon queenslandica TaxID=400682 RepID=A0AAN0J5T1_AMPQE|nr:PREDICTED: uncharacterized protein LOC109582172 [Amphimedon queenslandica]|eukprot:XP_019852380.1 PREDICTED: uncharacterized protein LOC109582172 [Amphimedon queenslandica]
MKKPELIIAVCCLIQGARAQKTLNDVLADEVGLIILVLAGVVVFLICCTWLLFTICMCDIAVAARKARQRDRELEEFYAPTPLPPRSSQRQMESVDFHNAAGFIHSQYRIEEQIRRENQQRQGDERQWNPAPPETQQRILSTFQSLTVSNEPKPSMPKPGGRSRIAGLHYASEESGEDDNDSDDTINSNNIIDIMNMPTIQNHNDSDDTIDSDNIIDIMNMPTIRNQY